MDAWALILIVGGGGYVLVSIVWSLLMGQFFAHRERGYDEPPSSPDDDREDAHS